MKEVVILKNARKGRAKGRRSDDFLEEELGGFNTTTDTIIRIPRLRAESQYT